MASNTSSSSLFIAGAVGGVAECVAVQPFDMLKTRFQLSPVPNPSIWSSLQAVVKEGGFLRLYRGILPEAGEPLVLDSGLYAPCMMSCLNVLCQLLPCSRDDAEKQCHVRGE